MDIDFNALEDQLNLKKRDLFFSLKFSEGTIELAIPVPDGLDDIEYSSFVEGASISIMTLLNALGQNPRVTDQTIYYADGEDNEDD